MKKLFLLLTSFALFFVSFGTTAMTPAPKFNANNIFIPIGKTGMKISLMELSSISLKDFETLTNRKMIFFDRLAFKAGQKKLQKNISADGTLKKKFDKHVKKYFSGESGFHTGGFALGFFLLLIGVLIAYVINDDYKKNRVKWAWLGFSISIAIWTLVAALVSQGVY